LLNVYATKRFTCPAATPRASSRPADNSTARISIREKSPRARRFSLNRRPRPASCYRRRRFLHQIKPLTPAANNNAVLPPSGAEVGGGVGRANALNALIPRAITTNNTIGFLIGLMVLFVQLNVTVTDATRFVDGGGLGGGGGLGLATVLPTISATATTSIPTSHFVLAILTFLSMLSFLTPVSKLESN